MSKVQKIGLIGALLIFLGCLIFATLIGLYFLFTQPFSNISVPITAMPEKTVDPTVIGMWEDDSMSDHKYDHVVIFRLVKGKYYQTEYYKNDGSSGTTELKTKIVNGQRRYSDSYDEYMIIESNGNLAYYDSQGFIYDVQPVK